MKCSDILRWGLNYYGENGWLRIGVKPQINMAYLTAENVKIDARLRCRDTKEIPRREIHGG